MSQTITITRKVDGRTYSIEVPAVERVPGEVGVEFAVGQAAEVAIAAAVAEAPPSPAGLLYIRRALGLTAARLAELLGVRAETISRWENAATPFDRAAWVAVGDLALERAGRPSSALSRMEALIAGREPPKRVRVELHLSQG
ncbi:MAG: helix-turn-helix domain-containing protein [Deltaproteobacteria bacterium]|nr:helix-turn-helix domain-containing protein [Deltaproteobacteria bacterium]